MNFGVTEGILVAAVLTVLLVPVLVLSFGIRWYMNRKANSKLCPFCAESINLAARVCRFCQREIA